MHRNIPDVHPAAVIAAFHTNVHNRKMREKMNIRLPRTVNELYTLADKCARAEEGRRLPEEDAGVEVDSEDDDAATPKKKGRKRNRKRKGKTVMAVEVSGNSEPAKKAKTENPARRLLYAPLARRQQQTRSPAKLMGHTAIFTAPKAMISKSADKSSTLSRSRKLSMKSATRRRVKMVLEGPARSVMVAEEATAARPSSRRRNRLGAVTRKKMTMRMMTRTKMSLVNMSSRKRQKPCALTGVLPCTPLTANSSSGRVRLMQWNRQWVRRNH
jgi:hypothetical protein